MFIVETTFYAPCIVCLYAPVYIVMDEFIVILDWPY